MSNAKTWLELAARCKAAIRPDREIDADFALALGMVPDGMQRDGRRAFWFVQTASDDFDTFEAPYFTEDLSTITNFVDVSLPGWWWNVSSSRPVLGAPAMMGFGGNPYVTVTGATPALAMSQAVARAQALKHGAKANG